MTKHAIAQKKKKLDPKVPRRVGKIVTSTAAIAIGGTWVYCKKKFYFDGFLQELTREIVARVLWGQISDMRIGAIINRPKFTAI